MEKMFFSKMFVGILFLPLVVKAQLTKNVQDYPKNMGINITQSKFDKLVKREITVMEQNQSVHIKDLITMVKIYNTIVFTDSLRETNRQDKAFCDLFDFDDKYEKLFIDKLHAGRSVGFGYHSKQYHIYLGGLPEENSKFKIIGSFH